MNTEPSERARFVSTAKEIVQAHTHETRAVGHTDCDACLDADANAVASIVSAQNDAATRMRERCVEKVRERAGAWREERYMNDLERRRFNAYAEEADKIANALESLTLDGAEPLQPTGEQETR